MDDHCAVGRVTLEYSTFSRVWCTPPVFTMGMSRPKPTQSRYFRRLGLIVLAVISSVAAGQDQISSAGAILQGTVRDSTDAPIAGASVRISSGAAEVSSILTDTNGAYRSAALPAGEYKIRVAKAGFEEMTFGPVVLKKAEARSINLKLIAATAAKHPGSSSDKPEFYEEPQFIVAGVTDTLSHGGHGSDVTSRTSQSLTQEVAHLHDPAGSPRTTTSDEKSLRQNLERNPNDFDSNHQLGVLLADAGKPVDALPFLERAHQIRKDDYDTACLLAEAYARTNRDQEARGLATALLTRQDKAELHHLLGDLNEKQKDPLAAVREYQRAVELSPTESNLFDWGTELLVHRTFQPAIEVFTRGHRQFPNSSRMLLGLGIGWYASGSGELAAKYVGEASDLDPVDPQAYIVLGKMTAGETSVSPAVVERFARFTRLQPDNAQANYYYAVALWKQSRATASPETEHQVETLLKKALSLDPALSSASLQIGVLYEERRNLPQAVAAYESAAKMAPQLKEAHYRLAQLYRRTGEKSKAEQELATYNRLSREAAALNEREAREIPQFVYTLRDSKSSALPQ